MGAVDATDHGVCPYVVVLGTTGPARVIYAISEPKGPTWTMQFGISERRRRRALLAALVCGAALGSEGRGRLARLEAVGSPAWMSVSVGHGAVWVPLGPDRTLNGVAILDLFAGLVPARVWETLAERREAAWLEWAHRPRGDVRVLDVEDTRPDSRAREAAGRQDVEATRREPVDQGPWDRRVAGAPRAADGWPGIRHGGGYSGGGNGYSGPGRPR
ncbi:hypothetical protein [Spirillospora sp. CA-294931]|uniref:hypothetical protein n=1 Tax=Spirillospora sp. CA-294931 TaxID=3240042 RepID=UPI003D90398E